MNCLLETNVDEKRNKNELFVFRSIQREIGGAGRDRTGA